ncbi:hypothetical protein pdam_00000903 [Pocillopora damicornis]|uniref:Uncharacterized protein n=1 Tax=Pocillopora damicornis TaxID=46731 RepID=A0A3M6T5V6_POCDA|nr:hypothetical protein pdam_00000903 [Pocillopora damicornis]
MAAYRNISLTRQDLIESVEYGKQHRRIVSVASYVSILPEGFEVEFIRHNFCYKPCRKQSCLHRHFET